MGGPEKASQKGELFESSVIQKRPFNVRTWGAEENVGGIAVNYQSSATPARKHKFAKQLLFLWGLKLRSEDGRGALGLNGVGAPKSAVWVSCVRFPAVHVLRLY